MYICIYIYIYEFRYTQHRDSMFGFQFNVGLMLNLLLLGSWGWISFRIYELGPLADFLRSLGRLAKLSMVTVFCLTLFFWYNQLWILVGGFNPFEKYAPQNGNPSPRKGENKKNIWNHHLDQLWIAFGACFNCENIHPRNLQQDLLNGPLNLSI